MVHSHSGICVAAAAAATAAARESLMSHFTASRLGRGISREVGCSFVTVLELGRLTMAGASETSVLLSGGVVLVKVGAAETADFTLPGAFLVGFAPAHGFIFVLVAFVLIAAAFVLTDFVLARATLEALVVWVAAAQSPSAGTTLAATLVPARVTPVALLPRASPDPGLASSDLKAFVFSAVDFPLVCAGASLVLSLLVRAEAHIPRFGQAPAATSALLEDDPLSRVEGLMTSGAALDSLRAGLGSFDLK